MKKSIKTPINRAVLLALSMSLVLPLSAQDESAGENGDSVEEVVVVGTQIKGAKISEALAVSVIGTEDIELLGIDSGDELLDLIPENGQNFFSEAENISGGVNSARGDIGAYNLRNLGTGNTLVLLNGRRMVNHASYQTEEVGGSFVPVNTVNANSIPVGGTARVEVLRDGASAIYGADAVAGVINHVTKKDFDGLSVRGKYTVFDGLPRDDKQLTVEWGNVFNGGDTDISVFANYYDRGRVNSQDDARWANADFRSRIPEGSPWFDSSSFRNDSANSLYGQYDVISSLDSAHSLRANDITDSSGEFETYPAGDPRCSFAINEYICGAEDGQGTERYNLNANRDLTSDLQRFSMFANLNHTFQSGMESFTEFLYYHSDTNLNRHPSAPFSSSKLVVAADNYYNPFGPIGSPNRLPDSVIGTDVPAEGLALLIDNYRFAELPRIVDNKGTSFRFLQGLRGSFGADWDWEGAFLWSKAESEDITRNRVSNTLIQEALNDTTAAAYNPFSAGVDNNIERALIDVRRDNETELTSFDFRVSNNEIFSLPAGPVGFLGGIELRNESFDDDRDPRLDGTIQFTDNDGDTFPFVSDVVNSSPSPDSSGDRDVTSLFAELQVPVLSNLDVQAALRYEDLSDSGDTTVGKFAFGWRPWQQLLVRGSWSEAFRAPNLVTVNEGRVARTNTRTDWVCTYAADFGGDPDQDTLDCRNSIQRTAQGSELLVPEESDNISFGLVWEPLEDLSLTLDYWSIEKEGTIGLFGEENHTLLELARLLEQGNANCGASVNPAVVRDAPDPGEQAFFDAAGICHVGAVNRIDDAYANLSTRTVEGHDIGIYYGFDTSIGSFNFKYNGSFLDKFEQDAGGLAQVLVDAQANGDIPANYPVDGFADLRRRDGNQESRQTASLRWNQGNYGASLSAHRISDFYQSSLTLIDDNGQPLLYEIPAVTTMNASFDYDTVLWGGETRFRFGIRNLTGRRAPLADRFFGFFADAHRDYGPSYYLDIRYKFY